MKSLAMIAILIFSSVNAQNERYEMVKAKLNSNFNSLNRLQTDTCFKTSIPVAGIGLHYRYIAINGDITCSKEYEKLCDSLILTIEDSLYRILITDTMKLAMLLTNNEDKIIALCEKRDSGYYTCTKDFNWKFSPESCKDYYLLKEIIESMTEIDYYNKDNLYVFRFKEIGNNIILVLVK